MEVRVSLFPFLTFLSLPYLSWNSSSQFAVRFGGWFSRHKNKNMVVTFLLLPPLLPLPLPVFPCFHRHRSNFYAYVQYDSMHTMNMHASYAHSFFASSFQNSKAPLFIFNMNWYVCVCGCDPASVTIMTWSIRTEFCDTAMMLM